MSERVKPAAPPQRQREGKVKPRKRTPEQDRAVAIHEAGHAQLAFWHDFELEELTVDAFDDFEGCVRTGGMFLGIDADRIGEDREYALKHAAEVLKRAEFALAGFLAEKRARVHRPYGYHDDFEHAFSVIETLCGGDTGEAQRWIDLAVYRCSRVLEIAWPQIEALADALLRERTISGQRALDVIRSGGAGAMSERAEPAPAMSKHRLLTDADLAERWGVSKYTVGDLRRSGVIPFIHITPKLTRFRLEDIEEYEQRRRKVR